MRWLWWLGWVVVALVFLALVLKISPFDPLPSAVACADTNLVYADVKVQPDRAGHIGERDFLGCTAYWYEYGSSVQASTSSVPLKDPSGGNQPLVSKGTQLVVLCGTKAEDVDPAPTGR
jgi:hypothetical protein